MGTLVSTSRYANSHWCGLASEAELLKPGSGAVYWGSGLHSGTRIVVPRTWTHNARGVDARIRTINS